MLVKDQADPTQNGIYTVSEGEWFRAADARTARTLQKGTTVHTQVGTINAGRVFEFSADAPVVRRDAIAIAPFVPPDVAEVVGAVVTLRDETQVLKHATEASAGQAAASASTSAANAGQTAADVACRLGAGQVGRATRRCMARASSRRRPPRSALVWLAVVPWSAAPAAQTALSMWRLPAAPVLAALAASLSLTVQ
ncbi:hypothetical protein [Mesorhizobium sp.]|uniref:hypothetical protein n=1 Tax=Mesorhizobium sp. TaxID=1871066 RepID=UPI000FE65165|nr:hypothetical protein [Mesorhizobium sp.]RWO87088.1 MAG: hypothetical protein EOQ95_21205 [Mesorhizobium sp.]